jgi:hypothetical protein
MYTTSVPRYAIDLTKEEAARWEEVILCERTVAGQLIAEAAADLQRVPEVFRWVFAQLYRFSGGLYRGEIESWARALEVSPGTATMLNCAYELSHLRWPRPFGCTAGVRWIDGLGMVHVRNLDWPLRGLGEATRLFSFRRRERSFVAVGVPGQVGVLSGMLPHAYSVTINWAPPASFPSFQFGPAFLLRDTLETCDRYEDAVKLLKRTRLSTSVFFTVCGIEKGQACVIERTPNEAVVREMTGAVLVQANHHVAERFRRNNEELREMEEGEEEPFIQDSGKRAESLDRALMEAPASCSPEEIGERLNTAPVQNQYTCQRMILCPAADVVRVWRRIEDGKLLDENNCRPGT